MLTVLLIVAGCGNRDMSITGKTTYKSVTCIDEYAPLKNADITKWTATKNRIQVTSEGVTYLVSIDKCWLSTEDN